MDKKNLGHRKGNRVIELLHGDCLELMRSIPDNSIDMVLTDPPYGTTACKWDTVIPFTWHVESNGKLFCQKEFFNKFGDSLANYRFWEDEKRPGMWEQLKRITKNNGSICLFGSEPFSSRLRLSNIKMFKYDWIWLKNFGSGFATAKKMPLSYSEIISVFYSKQPTYNPQFIEYSANSKKRIKDKAPNPKVKKNNIQGIAYKKQDWNVKRGSYPKRHITFTAPPNSKGRLHPTQKPVALLEYLIKTYTLENETILDFTAGSGSTGEAALNLNRGCVLIEKDEKYFKIAQGRLKL